MPTVMNYLHAAAFHDVITTHHSSLKSTFNTRSKYREINTSRILVFCSKCNKTGNYVKPWIISWKVCGETIVNVISLFETEYKAHEYRNIMYVAVIL